MSAHSRLERTLTETLGLSRRPVAVTFQDVPPRGVEKFTGTVPSSCSFWRLAAEGRVFYTVPSDHFNCPVGSFTHNIALPPEREDELKDVLAMMWEIDYIRMEDILSISRLPATPAVTVYAPLSQTPVTPDAVLIAGTPAKLMLLHEAAIRAAKAVLPLLGRPACTAIPAALSGGVASSLGCIGSRVYTGLADDQFYTVVAGADLDVIVGELDAIVTANAKLAEYHLIRRTALATA